MTILFVYYVRMDFKDIVKAIEKPDMLDYGIYLRCDSLLSSQTPIADLSNPDELQFQIVHQVEELWMKLINFTLAHIGQHLKAEDVFKCLTLFDRTHILLRHMISQLDVLETMSPKDYQEIRLRLGNGSGQESPGFRLMLRLPPLIWMTFESVYLVGRGLSVRDIYDDRYTHDDAYALAEKLTEFDSLLQRFRSRHLVLIRRSIGASSKSLKGRPVDILETGAKHSFFPELWKVRSDMTDDWGASYGAVRASLSAEHAGV